MSDDGKREKHQPFWAYVEDWIDRYGHHQSKDNPYRAFEQKTARSVLQILRAAQTLESGAHRVAAKYYK